MVVNFKKLLIKLNTTSRPVEMIDMLKLISVLEQFTRSRVKSRIVFHLWQLSFYRIVDWSGMLQAWHIAVLLLVLTNPPPASGERVSGGRR